VGDAAARTYFRRDACATRARERPDDGTNDRQTDRDGHQRAWKCRPRARSFRTPRSCKYNATSCTKRQFRPTLCFKHGYCSAQPDCLQFTDMFLKCRKPTATEILDLCTNTSANIGGSRSTEHGVYEKKTRPVPA